MTVKISLKALLANGIIRKLFGKNFDCNGAIYTGVWAR